jgi:hypothetical protein
LLKAVEYRTMDENMNRLDSHLITSPHERATESGQGVMAMLWTMSCPPGLVC